MRNNDLKKSLNLSGIAGRVMAELKREARRLYGARLRGLVLYGSHARGKAREGSDIDVAVLLDGPVVPGREIERMLDIITDLGLKYNVLVSVYPVSPETLQSVNSPLLMNIRREGVSV